MSDDREELLEAFDIEQWLDDEGIEYKKGRGSSGWQLNVKECPNPDCHDRRWRTYLNAETGLGNCFVCNTKYNKTKFVRMYLDLNFADTMKRIREFSREQGWRPKRKIEVAVNDGEVKLPVSIPLPTPDGQNLSYLEERGFDGEIAQYFHLRFCQAGWWMFKNDDGSTGTQDFANRVIVPVYDLDGTLKTFQGRDVTGLADNKYLFPKALPGTGRFLLNGQNVLKAKRVVIGEGIFDVAATKLALDQDVQLRGIIPIGTFGKHLSYGDINGNDQLGRFIQLKRDGLEEATFMWDGGEKELIAAINGAELLRKVGIACRIALLPAGKDPNEISPEEVRKAFYSAEPYSSRLAIKWRLRNPYRP